MQFEVDRTTQRTDMGKKSREDKREAARQEQIKKATAEEKMAEMQYYYAMLESKNTDNVDLNALTEQEQIQMIERLSLEEQVDPNDQFASFAAAIRRQNATNPSYDSIQIPQEFVVPEEIEVEADESTSEIDAYSDEPNSAELYLKSPVDFEVPNAFATNEIVQELKQRIVTLNERIETVTLCDLCMERGKTLAMIPCGHLTCNTCKQKSVCPFCSVPITDWLTIYL